LLSLGFSACATIFNNKQTTASASSGASTELTILQNGSVVYQGTLPAVINVNGSNNYTIQFTDKDGKPRTLQMEKKLSGWFIADILLLGGWIIDLITGDVMVYDKELALPISYSANQQFLLINDVPDGIKDDLKIVGNIYQ